MNQDDLILKNEFTQLISKRIDVLRKQENLTIESLAYKSGLSKGGLSEILRGRKMPNPFTIAKVCAGLGIKLKDFYDFKEFEDYIIAL